MDPTYPLWAIVALLVAIAWLLLRVCGLLVGISNTVFLSANEIKSAVEDVKGELPRKTAHAREVEALQWADEIRETEESRAARKSG
jgi:hypothetical protein